jgi:putative hydrolase of the HAD superfamily
MIKGILFDLDNTLVDFMKMKNSSVEAAADAMIDAGLDMPKDKILKELFLIYEREGIEHQFTFDKFLEERFDYVDYKILASGINAYRRQRLASLVTYPHVQTTLLELIRRGIRLGVVSDAPKLQGWLRLVQLGLQHMFDPVVTFDDTGIRKPAPEPFLKGLEGLRLQPEECLMVGDWDARDIIGAKALGMKTAFARYGDNFNTGASHADYELKSIKDLLSLIDSNG